MTKISYFVAAFLAIALAAICIIAVFIDKPSKGASVIEETSDEKSETGNSSEENESTQDESSVHCGSLDASEISIDSSQSTESEEISDETVSEPVSSESEPLTETWEYDGLSVRHLFTHCLIAWPELAPSGAFRDCITVSEWKNILQQLYDNNFVLIDINYMYETYTEKDGTQKIRIKDKVTVPKGKKPVVISIDDVVYDPKKTNQGMVDRLVVKDGELWAYTLFNDGREDYSQDNEIFTILESFVKEHPDFSYNNAKCTLCLTGFCGILGYRTSPSFAGRGIDYRAEREKAKEVVDWLKKHGYSFASHSYAHGMMSKFTPEQTEKDCKKWKEEVGSLVGDTCIFIYPYGDWPAYDTRQHKILLEYGFKFFCGTSTYNYLITGFPGKGDSVGNAYCDRFTVAGTVLERAGEKNNAGVYGIYKRMSEYFDPFEVYDNGNRPKKLVRPDDLS